MKKLVPHTHETSDQSEKIAQPPAALFQVPAATSPSDHTDEQSSSTWFLFEKIILYD
jgi:hypothetical protein